MTSLESLFATVAHPERLRIIMVLAGVERTPAQIAAALPDLPRSSIYRHLAHLQRAGAVEVAGERQARGTVERRLRLAAAALNADQALSAAQITQLLVVFLAQIMREFEHYLAQPDADLAADGGGFRTAVVYATDAEWHAALGTIAKALGDLHTNPAGADRRPRRFAAVMIPLSDQEAQDELGPDNI